MLQTCLISRVKAHVSIFAPPLMYDDVVSFGRNLCGVGVNKIEENYFGLKYSYGFSNIIYGQML